MIDWQLVAVSIYVVGVAACFYALVTSAPGEPWPRRLAIGLAWSLAWPLFGLVIVAVLILGGAD